VASAVPSRRALVATIATVSSAALLGSPDEAEAFPFGLFEAKGPKLPPNVVLDRTLAYTFTYPIKTSTGAPPDPCGARPSARHVGLEPYA
jgi:hypothetical protein